MTARIRVAESHTFRSDHGCTRAATLRRAASGGRSRFPGRAVPAAPRARRGLWPNRIVPKPLVSRRTRSRRCPTAASRRNGRSRWVHELLPGEAEPGDGTGIGQMRPMGRRRPLGAGGAPRVPLDEGIHRLLRWVVRPPAGALPAVDTGRIRSPAQPRRLQARRRTRRGPGDDCGLGRRGASCHRRAPPPPRSISNCWRMTSSCSAISFSPFRRTRPDELSPPPRPASRSLQVASQEPAPLRRGGRRRGGRRERRSSRAPPAARGTRS